MTGNKGEVQRKIMGRKEKVGGNNNVDYCSMFVMSVQHRASSGAYTDCTYSVFLHQEKASKNKLLQLIFSKGNLAL